MAEAPFQPTEAPSQPTVGACPSCGADALANGTLIRCACTWTGRILRFNPPPRTDDDIPLAAMPDDVVCTNHPSKAATTVCAGTGNYICALCAVEVDGRTYSADYLEANKTTQAPSMFERTLERPDRSQGLLLLVGLLIFGWASPLILIFVVYQFVKHRRLRRENELYREVSGNAIFIVNLVVFSILSVIVLIALLSAFV